MACSELEFAIRSLGFPVSYDEVQDSKAVASLLLSCMVEGWRGGGQCGDFVQTKQKKAQ